MDQVGDVDDGEGDLDAHSNCKGNGRMVEATGWGIEVGHPGNCDRNRQMARGIAGW